MQLLGIRIPEKNSINKKALTVKVSAFFYAPKQGTLKFR